MVIYVAKGKNLGFESLVNLVNLKNVTQFGKHLLRAYVRLGSRLEDERGLGPAFKLGSRRPQGPPH